MKIGSLFAGIGGLELGLERAGVGCVAWQCEIDPTCREVRLAVERGWARRVGWDIPDMAGVDDGIPVRLGAARKAYGNSVCVPWAEEIGKAIVGVTR